VTPFEKIMKMTRSIQADIDRITFGIPTTCPSCSRSRWAEEAAENFTRLRCSYCGHECDGPPEYKEEDS
jgi:uncharacterized protein (DUF983 family)